MDFCIIRCISVDGVMKMASVIMCIKILAVITLIICYRVRTCKKPVFDWGRLGYYACTGNALYSVYRKCPVQALYERCSFLVQMIKAQSVLCALGLNRRMLYGEQGIVILKIFFYIFVKESWSGNLWFVSRIAREFQTESLELWWKFGICFFDFVFVILIF